MSSISTDVLWRVVVLLKAAQFSTQQSANTGQLTLESGEILHINTSEPSAAVVDNRGNRRDLLVLAESNHSFINQLGDSREWKYGVARLVIAKDIILNSNSSVNISGQNALSVESLEGNIVVKTMIDLSCAATELGGKCVGGYMPIDKPKDWYSSIIPGNGPGGTSANYLNYWSNQCIGGSGHGGKGGNPANQDVQASGYSGLEYGKEDTHVLLGGSSGSYLEKSAYNITKPGHGGGAIQFVARKGSIVIEAKIKANAQQTLGNYEIYSGSSGGLIRLEANEVQIKNGGSLEVNGAHAGKTGHTQAEWTEGSAGGAGGIVHILASGVFLSSGSISLKPGNSTGCASVDKASPGFLLIRDHSGHRSMFWNNDTVFPIIPEGFSWPSTSSNTVLLPSKKSSTFIVTLTQPFLNPTKNGSSTFPMASFPTTKELIIAATAVYTSSVVDLTSNQVRQFATDISHHPTATKFPTDLTVVTSAYLVDTASEWEELLKNVTYLKTTIGTSHSNSWTADIQKLALRFQTLVEKETLTGESVERFLQILNEFSIIINIIPGKHQETMKSVATSLMTTAELSFERRNEDKWKTTNKLPTVLCIVENITLALGKTTTQNQPFKFEHYSKRTVVQVVTFKNNGDSKTMTHLMLPDITRTNLTVWKDIRDAVLIPLDGQQTFQDELTVSIIIHRNITNILPTGFTERTEERDNDFKVASHIISCSMLYNSRLVATDMIAPVELHFHYPDKRSSRSLCVFWDPRVSAWSTDGVRTLQINKTHASCHSTHLTSFAVLTQFKEVNISEDNELALSIVTYIGCGLSIACLFVTLLVYLAFETLSSERHKIHMSLAFALLLAQSLFLSGIKVTKYKILCRVIAVGLHYLFSAAFTWMCIEGFHLYVMIVSVFSADSVRMKYYYLVGWGVPVVIVGVAASVHPAGYGTNKVCWLSTEDLFIWVFLGPVVAVIAINLVILTAVMKVVTDSASATLTKTDYGHVKAGIKSVAVLLPLLGVSWVFGLLTINKKAIAFQYIFAISNSFQGVFIFLAHCVGSNDVRSAFKRMRQRQQLSRASDNASSVAAPQVNLARSTANDQTKRDNTEHKSAKKPQEKMRFSLRTVPNTKVVKVKATKDRFEAAHLQIRRTYQMPHKESPRVKDCNEMPSLNCPQEIILQTHSANRKRSSKPM